MATISTNDIVVNYKLGDVSGLAQLEGKLSNLTKDEQAALAEAKRLTAQFQKMGNEGKAGAEKVSQGLSSANSGMGQMSGMLGKIGPLLAATFSATAIIAFGKEVINTTAKFEQMQKAIDFASGSAEKGAENMQFLRDISAKLGLDLTATAEGYKTFAAASILAGQSNKETNRQFEAVSKAVAAMGLSAEDSKGVLLALGQVMSKGTVSAEELRGQIGERLPGAFNLAAKAMGVSTMELGKMMQKGEVASTEFLPKFATELEKTFGPAAAKNLGTLTASQNKFNSAIDNLILSIGNKLQPFLKGSYDLAAGIANQIAKAAGGNQQKKASEEAIAAKKVEMELAKAVFDLDQTNTIRITKSNLEQIRQKIAAQKVMEMDVRISKNLNDQANARINNDKLRLAELQKEQKVLVQMETIYTDMAKIDVVSPKKESVELTKEELKALKDMFALREKMFDTQTAIRKLRADLRNDPVGIIGADVAYFDALYKLQIEYKRKGLAVTDDEIELTRLKKEKAASDMKEMEAKIQKESDDERKKQIEKTEKEIADIRKRAMDGVVKRNNEQNDELKKSTDRFEAKQYEQIQKEIEMRKEAERMTIEMAQMTANQIFNLQSQYAANDLARKQRQFDEEIRLADGNQQKITEIEEKRRAAEKEARIKQFKADQMQAIANVIFNTAPIIAKYAAGVVTAPLATIAAASAALQIGFILAQPVPEFAKGVENFEGGPAIVGEKGRELVRTDSGSYLTPDRATLTYLPRGADVITAPKTRELLAGNSTLTRGRNEWSAIDTAPIAKAIMGMPVQSLEISERGLERYVTKGNRTTKILNKKRGANL
jgi:tape measure domain-containing protein